MTWLDRYGYSLNLVAVLLWPFSLLFGVVARTRRWLYRQGLLRDEAVEVPVIVVGNITVGGTGKTPLVIRLVELLREAGYQPGVVSRGYGGQSTQWPRHVTVDSDPRQVGDESVLLARRCRCPVVVDPDRVAAARALLATYDCNVILSDDGLQHYRLRRDLEIAVVDGFRRLGNLACLPAGPLREPPSRLREVDFVVGNGVARGGEYIMSLQGDTALNLADPWVSSALAGFRRGTVHAVAGIGDPRRFFDHLRHARLRIIEHPFPDHHLFRPEDLQFRPDLPLLMTEKDAVKCRSFALEEGWYVPVDAQLDPEFEEQLLKRLATVAMAKGIQRQPRSASRGATRTSNRPPIGDEVIDSGQETSGHSGMPGQQSPTGVRQGPAGTDLQGKPAGLSDSRRHSGDAGVGGAAADGRRGEFKRGEFH